MASGNIYPKLHHNDEEDDEIGNVTAGLREAAISKKKATQKAIAHVKKPASHASIQGEDVDSTLSRPDMPLRHARVALKHALDVALEKNSTALTWIDQKVRRAQSQGYFSFRFTFGEVEGLNAASNAEYIAFIQLLDLHGYNAQYVNKGEETHKEVFVPSTTILLNFLPKKK